jgi:uncharacterized membrane protein YfcA
MDADLLWILVPVFAVISFVYGSVGLGGGSAYVAMMALLGMDHTVIPMVALSLNLIVAGGGFAHFLRGGHFRRHLFGPLILTSAPAAFFAAQVPVSRALFQGLLGGLLLLAAVRLLVTPLLVKDRPRRGNMNPLLLVLLGLVLGAAAGLTGIGGGIYLAPLLLVTRMATPKEAAALSSGLVVVNSAAGLAGRIVIGTSFPWSVFLPLAATVLVAGQLGAFRGSSYFRPATVRAVVGWLVLLVSIRLLVNAYG